MRRDASFRFFVVSTSLAFALAFGFAAGCSDDPPPVKQDVGTVVDSGVDAPQSDAPIDGPASLEPAVWPDLSPDVQKPPDIWPWPETSYSTTSFGCQADSDCFGQKCCATPWGVKICAPTCEPAAN